MDGVKNYENIDFELLRDSSLPTVHVHKPPSGKNKR